MGCSWQATRAKLLAAKFQDATTQPFLLRTRPEIARPNGNSVHAPTCLSGCRAATSANRAMTAPEAPSDGRMACTRASSVGAGMPRPISGHTCGGGREVTQTRAVEGGAVSLCCEVAAQQCRHARRQARRQELDNDGMRSHRREVAGEGGDHARGDVEGQELVAPQLPPRHVPKAPQRKHVELRQRRQPHVRLEGSGLQSHTEAPQRNHVELEQQEHCT